MNRIGNAINNLIFGIVFRCVTLIGPLIVRIIVIRTVGNQYLGVSGVFTSILTMLILTDLGVSSAITYKCYKLYAEKNVSKINEYLGFYKEICKYIGITILIIGIAITPFLKYIVGDKLPRNLNIYCIYYILLFQTVISYFMYAYKTVILTVSQRQDIESKIFAVCNSLMYLAQIILLLIYKNYYIYLIVLPLSTFFVNLLRAYYTRCYFPEFYPCGIISNNEKKDILYKLLPLMGHRLSGIIILGADNIVISVFLGVTMVATYNNYYTIITSLGTFIVAIYAAIQPGIGNSVAMESTRKNYDDFKKISFLMSFIVGWMSICLVCLFEDFISFAYGNQYQLGIKTVLLLVLYFYIWRTSDLIMTYRDVVGKWNGDTIIPFISATLNLVINIILVKKIGVDGVIISTMIAIVFISIPFSLKVLIKNIFHESLLGYIKYYCINTSAIIVAGAITYFFCRMIHIDSILFQLVIKGIICVFIPNLFLLIIFHKKSEYIDLKNKIIKLRLK